MGDHTERHNDPDDNDPPSWRDCRCDGGVRFDEVVRCPDCGTRTYALCPDCQSGGWRNLHPTFQFCDCKETDHD